MDAATPVKRARVGIMYAGHQEYWPQFPGSRDSVVAGAHRFEGIVEENRVDVVMSDLVDSVELSYQAGRLFEQSGIDLLFVFLHTYVSAGRWLPGIMRLNVPIVLVTLTEGIDFEKTAYVTGMGIHIGSPCQMSEAYSALMRSCRTAADLIFGSPQDPRVKKEIAEWCSVANTLASYRDCVIGYMGHSYDGMLDMNFDPTTITSAFGVYVKMLEMCELVDYVQSAAAAQVQAKINEMKQVFDVEDRSYDPVTKPVLPEDIDWAARCAAGLEKLFAANGLSGLAYYYAGLNNIYERVGSNLIVGNTLLTLKGMSLAGEGDMKTCLAMKTTSALGAGGSFAEFQSVDYARDQVYVGHDGPHDLRITSARPVIRGLSIYHGKRGYGISVEFSIKQGDMTMVSLGSDAQNRFKFVVAEGESMPGRLPHIGNTVSRAFFGKDVGSFLRAWAMAGVPHHQSLCVGHIASAIQKLGKAMKMEVEVLRRSE